MMETTDEEIARKVQKGDTQSFGLLIERYEQKLLRYAKKFIFDSEEAKDLVQEVFMKAYMNIRSFEISRRFSPWIYRVAHNEFINAIRKKKKSPVFYIDFDIFFPHPISTQGADSEANKQDLKRMLDECLGKLDPKYREPLILYYFEEMDYKEISEILKIPISTVGVRLQRGKSVLKKIMKNLDTI